MIHSDIEIRAQWPAPAATGSNGSEFPYPFQTRGENSNRPAALAVSSDEKVLQRIAASILQCDLSVLVAFTVAESRRILEKQKVSLVVCDEWLLDGKYEEILEQSGKARPKVPVIIVSPTADWPDYLKAIGAGAFDYIAHPPIDGDLPRSIRSALTPQQETKLEDTAGTFFCL